MGGVWCKAERGQHRPSPHSPKESFNDAVARWLHDMQQAYKKPKTTRRPPRPPQKPLRSYSSRLTISNPQLRKDESSDGWRTATLLVPEGAPVPPPRKKRRRDRQQSPRAAYSMDDLHSSVVSLSEPGLGLRSASLTSITVPVQMFLQENQEKKTDKVEEEKENLKINVQAKIDEEDEELEEVPEEIVPIEKETLFSSRTLLHSSLGYVDKLSAISEVSTISTESGFDDRTDVCKSSDMSVSGSVTSSDSLSRSTGLSVLPLIQNFDTDTQINVKNEQSREKTNNNSVSHITEPIIDNRDTPLSRKQWLQNILKQDPEPFYLSRGPETVLDKKEFDSDRVINESEVPAELMTNSLNKEGVYTQKKEQESNSVGFEPHNTFENASPNLRNIVPLTFKDAESSHSVLLDLIQQHSDRESSICNPITHKEESLFLKDTKTNIIYKSLSSDKLTDIYDDAFLPDERVDVMPSSQSSDKSDGKCAKFLTATADRNCSPDLTNQFINTTLNSSLTDYSCESPKLLQEHDIPVSASKEVKPTDVSCVHSKESGSVRNLTLTVKDETLLPEIKDGDKPQSALIGGLNFEKVPNCTGVKTGVEDKDNDNTPSVKDRDLKKESAPSSRRSSITDSLQEFEMSIYDMLNESKKNRDSSDEDEPSKAANLK